MPAFLSPRRHRLGESDRLAPDGTLHVPDPAPFRDALIAATALVHRMTVVTRTIADFQRFEELHVLNPWT